MGAQVVRQFRLFSILASARRPKSRAELAAMVAVSAKTVSRDIVDLQLAGVPVSEERDAMGRAFYHLDTDHRVPPGFDTVPRACRCGGCQR